VRASVIKHCQEAVWLRVLHMLTSLFETASDIRTRVLHVFVKLPALEQA